MIKLGAHVTNTQTVASELERVSDRILVGQKRVIEFWSNWIANDASERIRRTTSGSGMLAQSIMAEPATLSGDNVSADVVWGVAHGPLVEYGPSVDQWVIRATYANVLRWFSDGVVHYAKQVLHTWDRSQLRPHINPAADEAETPFMNDMIDVIRDEFE